MMGADTYKSWIENSHLEPISLSGKAIFSVKNSFMKDWISTHFRGEIVDILAKIDPKLGRECNIEFVVEKDRR
jgi:chromosomal replication initiation ATPase DnaA